MFIENGYNVLFPMANTIIWLHYDTILNAPKMPVWCSFAYFMIAIGVMLVLTARAVHRMELFNVEQVE